MRYLFIVVSGFLLTGCLSQTVDFYPVEGPLSQQVPLPILKATAEGVESNSGRLSMALPDGQKCDGRWSSVAPQYASVTSGSLFSIYGGALFGASATTGIMPGVNKGQAFMSCSRGATVDAEFYTGSGTANGYGIAKDSAGNVFKMLF